MAAELLGHLRDGLIRKNALNVIRVDRRRHVIIGCAAEHGGVRIGSCGFQR